MHCRAPSIETVVKPKTLKQNAIFAYNKESPLESNDPTDYTWSDIKGEQGVKGEKGEDGTQYYTWIAYSDNPDGNPLNASRDIWPYLGTGTKFTNTTTPAATVYNANTDGSYYMNKSITAIKKNSGGTMSFTFVPNGSGTTGIDNAVVDNTGNGFDPDAPVYNLNGQRVSKSAKGILIQGGKKFVRK